MTMHQFPLKEKKVCSHFKLTWEAGLMKLCDGIWTVSTLQCNGSGSSVLVNLLLQQLASISDCVTVTRAAAHST